jgi:hypothetical protein
MGDYRTLEDYKGWEIVWQASSGRLFVRRPGLFAPQHDFHKRPQDASSAIRLAKAWIDQNRR